MEIVAEIVERPPGGAGPSEPAGARASEGGALEAPAAPAAIPLDALPSATDDDLVRAAVGGQREAFMQLLGRYVNLLFWFVGGRLSDPVEIEEVAQESVVRAYASLPRLRAPGAFANWLLMIAENVLREKRRRDSRFIQLDAAEAGEQASGGAGGRPAGPPEAHEVLSREEFRGRLKAEIDRLPTHYRVVLALKYMNGMTVEEIASRIQVPVGTVRGRLSRAYSLLRGRLGRFLPGGELPGAADR